MTVFGDHPDPSPWGVVEGYHKSRCLWDVMHVLHIGVIGDVVASCLAELLKDGTLCQLMHLPPEASPDLVLLRTTLAAQQWAKERKLDLSIKPLTLASLNLGDGCKYPELDSQIKAARTRVLFEFTTKTSWTRLLTQKQYFMPKSVHVCAFH
ncbi:unnamed protein product [Cladocopium goreaui]|uniref:Uncharacterized protein n=1 Tax=Cladocopium goreaui TaxID=2562237 RepID=A0A9P1C9Q5_9DINO|nr:unnamed protein product [Cladocopium goreaui]